MIYIHIPFCRQICNYCDFHHSASLLKRDEVLAAIESELRCRRDYVKTAKTLYFGGGTPSVCTTGQIRRLVDTVRDLWGVEHFDEATLEANPEDLTPEYLDGLREAGITRLSIGIQSFVDEHLSMMNRRHSAEQAIKAVKSAQTAGFANITIDLMYGLPWLTEQQWESNINSAIELDVQHISAYHLTIEPNTILGKRGIKPIPDTLSEKHFRVLHDKLIAADYEHYEVSNFARKGFRAIHNSGYWSGNAYLGVGPSAHSYDGQKTRHWNANSNKLYLEGNEGESETLSEIDLHNEYLMTRLRTADGFLISDYEKRFDRTLASVEGLIIENGIARIDSANFLISDSVISSLFIV